MNATRTSTELAPENAWFKSSYSSGAEGNCIEAADITPAVAVRDSKDKGPALVFGKPSWTAFLGGIREGNFDTRA
ncbi:DUF397 domain-containing protein [Streptomyces longisporoflavus]|uniref:DUF397 domain-containing protein n=1 Tax=Streptomyces longisporoflavus TaxID=28044 RepID=A0ABW7R3V9_9ACTN